MKTKIEWATDVWNPVTGCSKVSQGCKNCYAETIANRFWGERKFTDVQLHPERLEQLSHWRKPRRIFVNSMSDLFHPDVTDEFIWRVFDTMTKGNRRHTYMILTKRPERMLRWFEAYQERFWHYPKPGKDMQYVSAPWPDPCIWLGVSVENQAAADERIPLLLQTPAAVRFVSVEPLLGKVLLDDSMSSWLTCNGENQSGIPDEHICCASYDLYGRHFHGIDWVICGGESGPHARPMHPGWVRSLRDQCQTAGVPFFFKQWGEWSFFAERNGEVIYERVGKKAAGRELDGRTWDEYPA